MYTVPATQIASNAVLHAFNELRKIFVVIAEASLVQTLIAEVTKLQEQNTKLWKENAVSVINWNLSSIASTLVESFAVLALFTCPITVESINTCAHIRAKYNVLPPAHVHVCTSCGTTTTCTCTMYHFS